MTLRKPIVITLSGPPTAKRDELLAILSYAAAASGLVPSFSNDGFSDAPMLIWTDRIDLPVVKSSPRYKRGRRPNYGTKSK